VQITVFHINSYLMTVGCILIDQMKQHKFQVQDAVLCLLCLFIGIVFHRKYSYTLKIAWF